MYYITLYLIIINISTFIIFVYDKIISKYFSKMRRLPEKKLILLILVGGVFGANLSMYFFRHKTRKSKFKLALFLGYFIILALILLTLFI